LTLKNNFGSRNVSPEFFDGIWFTVKSLLQKAYSSLQDKFPLKYKFHATHPPNTKDIPAFFTVELFENYQFIAVFMEFIKIKNHMDWFELLVRLINFGKKIWLSDIRLNKTARSICMSWLGFGVASFVPKVQWTEGHKKILTNLSNTFNTGIYTRDSFSELTKSLVTMFDPLFKEFLESNHMKNLAPASLDKVKKLMRRTTKGSGREREKERNRTISGGSKGKYHSKYKE